MIAPAVVTSGHSIPRPQPSAAGAVVDGGQMRYEPHTRRAPVNAPPEGGRATARADSKGTPPDSLRWAALRLYAEMYADQQRSRIALENRVRASNRAGKVDEGEIAEALGAIAEAEKRLARGLHLAYRAAVPPGVRRWQKQTTGIGEHLLARLLGVIGHPLIAQPYRWESEAPPGHSCGPTCKQEGGRHLVAGEPFVRNVAKLWAYCGHGDPARKRRKGMTADEAAALGNPDAKMILHLLAEACIKQVGSPANNGAYPRLDPPAADPPVDGGHSPTDAHRRSAPVNGSSAGATWSATPMKPSRPRSPYRDTYDLARIRYADREGWTLAHQHAAALRLVGKAILRDLWLAAHDEGDTTE